MIFITLLLLIITGILFLVRRLREKNKRWEKLNIKHVPPMVLFGNNFQAFLGKKNRAELLEEEYMAFPSEDIVGHFDYSVPRIIIRKPELIEKILIKDFSYFCDRVVSSGSPKSPAESSLFTMTGNFWRAMRYKLSPLFTTGKLKYMFEPMSDCGRYLITHLDKKVGREVDMKEVNGLFAMEVIGSCAFGIDAGVLRDPLTTFSVMGKKMFQVNFFRIFALMFLGLFPKLAAKFGISFISKSVTNYFRQVIVDAIEIRKKYNVERNDFVQLLMQLKEKGSVQIPLHDPGDDYLKVENAEEFLEYEITDDLVIGTSFTFIFAGFHTTAATLTYTLFELSQNLEIQEKARKEIQEKISYHGGITYDALKSMTYIDKVLKEAMRLHPAVPIIFRVCTKKYILPSGHEILPGEGILIPVMGLHKDPEYFSNPLIFNPDRFDLPPKPGTYLPFGEGPRICIAMRFALLEMKLALALLLSSYRFSLHSSTKTPLRMEPRALLMIPKDKVVFEVNKL